VLQQALEHPQLQGAIHLKVLSWGLPVVVLELVLEVLLVAKPLQQEQQQSLVQAQSLGQQLEAQLQRPYQVLFNQPYPLQHWAQPTWQLKRGNWLVQQAVPQVGFKDLMTGGGDFSSKLGNYLVQNPMQVGSAAGVMGGIGSYELPGMPKKDNYSGPLSRFSYDPDKYRPQMAAGGLADSMPAKRMAMGGHLGSYSDGGRLLKGPGDGMSDDIPAKIGSKQPARLADGEFVVPADVVSGIGNGSTDAGAKKLYAMMNKVRQARTGTKKQGKAIKADKYMPA
jgi:hypothetical protein